MRRTLLSEAIRYALRRPIAAPELALPAYDPTPLRYPWYAAYDPGIEINTAYLIPTSSDYRRAFKMELTG